MIAADTHLAICESCREQATDLKRVEMSVSVLRRGFATESKAEPTHLSYEQLEAYVDGDMDQADREIVDSHAELCATCGDELRDLQQFPSRMKVSVIRKREEFPVGKEVRSARVHPWLRRRVYWSAVGAAAVVVLFMAFETRTKNVSKLTAQPGTQKTDQVASAKNPSTQNLPVNGVDATDYSIQPIRDSAPSTGTAPTSGLNITGQRAHANAMCLECTDALPAAPENIASLIGKNRILLGTTSEDETFELSSPVGTYVEDVRPTFQWQPLAEATQYEVSVFDLSLNQVAESGPLSVTTWRPKTPLKRVKVYLWQVRATKNGDQFVAPAPPAPEAKFEIISRTDANSVARDRMSYSSHFVRGRIYAYHGLLDEAEREFQLVPASDAKYKAAQKFVGDLKHLRHRE